MGSSPHPPNDLSPPQAENCLQNIGRKCHVGSPVGPKNLELEAWSLELTGRYWSFKN